jgi:hypothetical protein
MTVRDCARLCIREGKAPAEPRSRYTQRHCGFQGTSSQKVPQTLPGAEAPKKTQQKLRPPEFPFSSLNDPSTIAHGHFGEPGRSGPTDSSVYPLPPPKANPKKARGKPKNLGHGCTQINTDKTVRRGSTWLTARFLPPLSVSICVNLCQSSCI